MDSNELKDHIRDLIKTRLNELGNPWKDHYYYYVPGRSHISFWYNVPMKMDIAKNVCEFVLANLKYSTSYILRFNHRNGMTTDKYYSASPHDVTGNEEVFMLIFQIDYTPNWEVKYA